MARRKGWISFKKTWTKCALLGIGIGLGDNKPRYPVVIIELGFWVLMLGPHYPAEGVE